MAQQINMIEGLIVTFDEIVLTARRIFTCAVCGRILRGEMEYKNVCQSCLTTGGIHAGTIPKEKRPISESVKARRRPPVETDVVFYNSMRWRRYSKQLRAKRPWCDIQMNYVLVNDLGLEDILPWYSKLDNELKYRFLRRKGYQGYILLTDVTDHIIPIKVPFSGSYWNPRNHQCASHKWHNVKRQMEGDEVCEEYIDDIGGRIPKRMQAGRKRLSDTDSQVIARLKSRPRGGRNLS